MRYTTNAAGLLVPVSSGAALQSSGTVRVGNDNRGMQSIQGSFERRFVLSEDGPMGKAGDVITQAVTPVDVSDVREVETYLGGYSPFGFGADLVSRIVLVDRERGQRRDLSKLNVFQTMEDRTGRNGPLNEVTAQSGVVEYATEEHGLAAYIPWSAENDAVANYNVRAVHATMISDKLALNREVRIWANLTDYTKWASTNYAALVSGSKWNASNASATRLLDLKTRIKASAQPVTDIFFNPDVAFQFLTSAEIIAYMRQMLGDSAPSPDVAGNAETMGVQSFRIPGFPTFTIVPSKVYNASTGALDYILGNYVVLATNPPGSLNDGRRSVTHMTFRYRGRSGTGWQVNEYVPFGKGLNGGTMFEAGFADSEFFGSNIVGGLLTNIIQ